ncbi:MAG TPA: diacylglycerol kinase family protein [Acidimicrobiales bacterium]|nr:diacylglycerol kinase family protein [Acidimicrobiales bacterium]
MLVRRLVVFVNAAAGSVEADGDDAGKEQRCISDAFAAVAPEVDVRVEIVDPAELQDRIIREWDSTPRPDALVVAGGDGTVNNAANAAAGTDIVLGVLPRGTFDHFAGDLGLPTDLEGAAAALVEGGIRRVDVAEVNGRVFVNNSLVGLYPKMVAIRDEVMDDRGWGKIRAVPLAVLRMLRAFPTHRLDLHGSNDFVRRDVRTPMLFVGNGIYEATPGAPPTRERLDGGVLGVEVMAGATRRRLVRAGLYALLRGTSGATDVHRASLERLEVRSRAARLQVAVDGEIDWFTPPLHYRMRPADLRILAPLVTPDPSVPPATS